MLPQSADEPRVAAWKRRVDWPLTGLALVFLAAYAWSVVTASIARWFVESVRASGREAERIETQLASAPGWTRRNCRWALPA